MSKITINFDSSEFECRCGCGLDNISPTVVLVCQMVRDHFNKPVIVTSGCRCLVHNVRVGGALSSQHTPDKNGMTHAADIMVKGVHPTEVYDFLNKMFPQSLGLGLYSGWVHIDDRIDKWYRWSK